MASVLEKIPGAQRALFRKYHIGGCSQCSFKRDETLTELCARNNLNVGEVIEHLKTSHQQDLKTQMSPAELARLRQEGKPHKILDVRTREEFEAARIEGSLLFTQETMHELMSTCPRDMLIIVCDHLGSYSLDAASYMAGHGFTNAVSLTGGLDAWSRDIDPKVPRYRLEQES